MNAKLDYADLKSLLRHPGYQKLQALWAHEYIVLMRGLQNAAAKSQESAWRYYAGQLKGADLMTGQLDRALLQIEKETEVDASNETTKTPEEILAEIRGERK